MKQNESPYLHCAKCGQEIVYAADPTPVRFRVFNPANGKELYLIVHTGCRRQFVAAAESVVLGAVAAKP